MDATKLYTLRDALGAELAVCDDSALVVAGASHLYVRVVVSEGKRQAHFVPILQADHIISRDIAEDIAEQVGGVVKFASDELANAINVIDDCLRIVAMS